MNKTLTGNGVEISVDALQIKIPIFNQVVYFIIGQSDKISLIANIEDMSGAEMENEQGEYIIWVKAPKLSTIVHEIYHVVEGLTENLMLGRSERAETQAYLTEFIFEKIYNYLNKKNG